MKNSLNIAMKKLILFLIFNMILFVPLQASGYGLGDAESQTVTIEGQKLKMKTIITPEIIDESNPEFNLKIELLDTVSGDLLSGIGGTVKILNSENSILFENDMYSSDSIITMNFKPEEKQSFDISGDKYGDQFWLSSTASPTTVIGPVFLDGGIYKIQINVKMLENNTIQTPNMFETILIIGEVIPFQVYDNKIKHDLRFITYFDTIENLTFDKESSSVKAEMKFNWDEQYIEPIPFVHSEVYLPLSWDVFTTHEINTFVNGIQVFGLVDKSQQEDIVIHFLINNKQLKNLISQIDSSEKEKIIFEVKTGELIEMDPKSDQNKIDDAMVQLSNGSDWKIYLWWEPEARLLPYKDVEFNIMFHDPDTNIMQKDITYDFKIIQNNDVILSKINANTPTGHDIQETTFEQEGTIQIIVENINGKDTGASFEIFVGDVEEIVIPKWIKNNAMWWYDGAIDDTAFASGIEYMIKEKIIQVPQTEKEQTTLSTIPDWVKNNAGWWANDQISDKDFASGLQFLIESGIINVN